MSEDPEVEELLDSQSRREVVERREARSAVEDEEALTHDRRADKARYLREKLEARVESEQPDKP